MDSNMFPHTITLFHFEERVCTKTIIPNVFYYDKEESLLNKVGLQTTSNLIVVINTDKSIQIKKGKDIIVKGECDTFFDCSSDEKYSESFNNLKSKYDIYTVSVVEENLYGEIPNIKLVCK